jgi:hypothetical protein
VVVPLARGRFCVVWPLAGGAGTVGGIAAFWWSVMPPLTLPVAAPLFG